MSEKRQQNRTDPPADGDIGDEQPRTAQAGDDGDHERVVLSADGLTKSFGSVTVIDDVSLTLEAGTVTALVGPNGSGKTTLLRVLAGLLDPTAGTVTDTGSDAARQVGYLPQNPAFRPGFTAEETLDFYTALADGDPETLLSRVGLGDAADRRVEALSGGMTRLLGLAQAMVGDPPVVILDEPDSGLDPGMRRQTFEVVEGLAASGTAVLCSSHDVTLVEEFADRVAMLDRGSLVAMGPPDELCRQHDHETLWALFDDVVDRPTDELDVVGVSE